MNTAYDDIDVRHHADIRNMIIFDHQFSIYDELRYQVF